MDKQEFIEFIKADCEALLVDKYKDNEQVLERIYRLCRETYLTQYSAKPVGKIGEDSIGYQIEESQFKQLREKIDIFIAELNESMNDVLDVLKLYYFYARTEKEANSRTYQEQTGNTSGHIGTLYGFDSIDWVYFEKGLKIKQ